MNEDIAGPGKTAGQGLKFVQLLISIALLEANLTAYIIGVFKYSASGAVSAPSPAIPADICSQHSLLQCNADNGVGSVLSHYYIYFCRQCAPKVSKLVSRYRPESTADSLSGDQYLPCQVIADSGAKGRSGLASLAPMIFNGLDSPWVKRINYTLVPHSIMEVQRAKPPGAYAGYCAKQDKQWNKDNDQLLLSR